MHRLLPIFLFMLCGNLFSLVLAAQCASTVSNFPYIEDFEVSDGGWTPGGTASDWAWGTPAKPLINAAGSGLRCWITGGLTLSGSGYNSNERAFLQSPCFDFSSLQYPYIRFLVYWETERQFDGASFQYSSDNGATWADIGAVNEPVNCLNANWFNYSPINNLSGISASQSGWSGTVQATSGTCRGTGGSGGWVTASHVMPFLAGLPNVIFRFTFGAGSQCNNYDGFAIDKIEISNAPPNTAAFTFSCLGNNLVQFNNQSLPCPTAFSWNFGDPASGVSNTDNNPNPSHVFSGLGTYTVSLVTSDIGNNNAPSAPYTQTINIISVATQVTDSIRCNGDANGKATVNVSGGGSPYTFSWSTLPVQTTATAINLTAGTYTVTVNGNNVCQSRADVVLTQPEPLQLSVTTSDATCTLPNGVISIGADGGNSGYRYSWVPAYRDTNYRDQLAAGTYSIRVTDRKGCIKDSSGIVINQNTTTLPVSLGATTTLCPGSSLVLNPGNYSTYLWQDNSTTATYTVTAGGIYSVTVTDNRGCTGTASVEITSGCTELVFPTAFSPDGNGVQDLFGPRGNSFTVQLYLLEVYNRWGEKVFESRQPMQKWDGTRRGKKQPAGTYVWKASFVLPGKPAATRQGIVVLIR